MAYAKFSELRKLGIDEAILQGIIAREDKESLIQQISLTGEERQEIARVLRVSVGLVHVEITSFTYEVAVGVPGYCEIPSTELGVRIPALEQLREKYPDLL